MVKIAHAQNFLVKILCFAIWPLKPIVSEIWKNFSRVGGWPTVILLGSKKFEYPS